MKNSRDNFNPKTSQEDWDLLGVQTYGLSNDLFIPIAVKDISTVKNYIGKITKIIRGRKRPINGFVIEAYRPIKNPSTPLWTHENSDFYYSRLHPTKQLWVHIDYSGYRKAWKRLDFDILTPEIFLDQVQSAPYIGSMLGLVHINPKLARRQILAAIFKRVSIHN